MISFSTFLIMFLLNTSDGLTWAGVDLAAVSLFRGFFSDPGTGVLCLYLATNVGVTFTLAGFLSALDGALGGSLESPEAVTWGAPAGLVDCLKPSTEGARVAAVAGTALLLAASN